VREKGIVVLLIELEKRNGFSTWLAAEMQSLIIPLLSNLVAMLPYF